MVCPQAYPARDVIRCRAMATEKTNGHDPMTVQMVELLREIRDEIRTSRDETRALREDVNARLDALKTVTENAHRHIHERIDEAHAEAIRNTEERTAVPDGLVARIERLEAAVFKKAS
jgi:hypothetical protein